MDYKIYGKQNGAYYGTVYGFSNEENAIRYSIKRLDLKPGTLIAKPIIKDPYKGVNYR